MMRFCHRHRCTCGYVEQDISKVIPFLFNNTLLLKLLLEYMKVVEMQYKDAFSANKLGRDTELAQRKVNRLFKT